MLEIGIPRTAPLRSEPIQRAKTQTLTGPHATDHLQLRMQVGAAKSCPVYGFLAALIGELRKRI